jgi:hypothetical protein
MTQVTMTMTTNTMMTMTLRMMMDDDADKDDDIIMTRMTQVNPLTPRQETICLLQNATSANNPSAQPLKVHHHTYKYLIYYHINTVCPYVHGMFCYVLSFVAYVHTCKGTI